MKTKSDTSRLIKFLWIIVVLVSIKTIFTDFGADNAYTMAMSYRHLSGDRMFLEMWEPHQTSIFFTDALMWVYGLIVPSFTGVAIYLQVCGTAFFAVIAYFLFREVRELAGEVPAHFATIFFLIFRAKQTVFPEFSNMEIGFSVLVLLCLVNFFKEPKKYSRLIFAALFLCLEVLSYPSCVTAFVAVVILICMYTDGKLKNVLIFTGTTAVVGIAYVLFFALRVGPKLFIECLKGIVDSDSHANTTLVGGFDYYRGTVYALAWIAIAVVITLAAGAVWKGILRKKFNALTVFGAVFFAGNAIMIIGQRKTGIDWTCCFYIIPVVLMALGFFNFKELPVERRRFFMSGVLISVASAIAAAMLTDLGIITSIAFLVLGGTVSFAAIKDLREKALAGVTMILMTVLFNRGIVLWGYGNQWDVWTVYEVERYVKGGPTKFLITDYMTSKMDEVNIAEFNQYIGPDDKLLIVGDEWLFDPAYFMFTEAEISNWSVIDTPFYNEEMLHYFEINPGKEPTVVAVKCWFGNLDISPDSFIMKWVEEGYEKMGDGSYFRFYRKAQSAE